MRVITPLLLGFGLALGPTVPADGAQAQPDDTLAITVTNAGRASATATGRGSRNLRHRTARTPRRRGWGVRQSRQATIGGRAYSKAKLASTVPPAVTVTCCVTLS